VTPTVEEVEAGATMEPSAEPYNFLSPQRTSKEQLAGLQTAAARAAAGLQAVLSTRLRQSVTVASTRLEEMTVVDAVGTLSTPCAAYLFDPGDGGDANGVLDLGTALASYAVDRLLGGPGSTPDAQRALTEMEQRVIKDVVDRALAAIGESMRDFGRLKPTAVSAEATTDNLAAGMGTDAVILTTFEVKAEEPVGVLTLCLPLTTVANFNPEPRTAPRARTASAGRNDARANLEAAVRRARVPVMVRFPAITLPARAVAMLTPGQTIQTALPLDVPVEVRVSGRLRFLGAPGQVHGTVGVRIVRGVSVDAGSPPVPTRARIL
jgi:flagellar motor switch protein FliM